MNIFMVVWGHSPGEHNFCDKAILGYINKESNSVTDR